MAYADALRSTNISYNDIADLIEGIGVAGYPLHWTDWTPTYGAGGSLTFGSVTTSYAKHLRIGDLVILGLMANGTLGGSASDYVSFSPPVAPAYGGYLMIGPAYICDNATWSVGVSNVISGTAIGVFKANGGNYSTSGALNIKTLCIYETAL